MYEEKELPFELNDDGSFMFQDGFIVTDEIVDASSYIFETPLLKPYVSKFTKARNKNITLANVFKICVLLDCSPNDLFNWEDWSSKVKESDAKVSNNDIKKMI